MISREIARERLATLAFYKKDLVDMRTSDSRASPLRQPPDFLIRIQIIAWKGKRESFKRLLAQAEKSGGSVASSGIGTRYSGLRRETGGNTGREYCNE